MKNLLYILFLIFSITFGYAQEIVTQDLQSANVNYTIKGIKYDEKTKRIIIIGDAGAGNESDRGSGEDSQEVLPGGKDYTFIDKDGKVWAVSEEGNVTQAGKMAQGGASTPQNTAGVDAKGNATAITAEGIRVTFKNSRDSKYAFDQPAKALNSDYKELNGKVIPFKAVENKKTEPFIASVEITDNSISTDSLIFKTSKGVPIDAKKVGNDYRLTLKGLYSYATEQVQAIIKQGDKYQVAGAFNLVHISPKTIKLNLVPTLGVSISRNQIQKVKDIYKKIAIDVDVSVKEAFDITPYLVNGKLPSEDAFGDLSSYSPAQNKVIEAYKQQRGVDLAYYIFVTDRPSSNGQDGYMRLGGQFGFVYDQQARTIAHELGHGALRLEHPFKEFKNVAQGDMKTLMDYNTSNTNPKTNTNTNTNPKTNTNFIYPDWKQVNDPKFKIYAFQKQSEGELAGGYGIAPNFKFIETNTNLVRYTDIVKDGFVGGFVYKNKDGNEEYYKWDGAKYVEVASNKTYPKDLLGELKNKDRVYILFDNKKPCDESKYITTNYNQIRDFISKGNYTSLVKYIDENRNKYYDENKEQTVYVRLLGCSDTTSSEGNLEDIIFKDKDLREYKNSILQQLNKDKNSLTEQDFSTKVGLYITKPEDLQNNSYKEEFKSKQAGGQIWFWITVEKQSNDQININIADRLYPPGLQSEDKGKLNQIADKIKNEPWYIQGIILYEVADLLSRGIEHLKITKSVWECTERTDSYKGVYNVIIMPVVAPLANIILEDVGINSSQLEQIPFAFACGLWDGVVDIVKSVPDLVKIATCIQNSDCRNEFNTQYKGFKEQIITDEKGNVICNKEDYICKIKELGKEIFREAFKDGCTSAHTVGTVVGPVAVALLGDEAAIGGVINELGAASKSAKMVLQFIQVCDKFGDVTTYVSKFGKVSFRLIKGTRLKPRFDFNGVAIIEKSGDKFLVKQLDDAGNIITKEVSGDDLQNISKESIEKVIRKIDDLANGVDKIFNLSKFKNTIAKTPGVDNTSLTNLPKSFWNDAYKFLPDNTSPYKTQIDNIILNGDQSGKLTEKLVEDIMTANGYKVGNGRYYGDYETARNGIDGFFYKGSISNPSEIIVIDAKQMNANGSVRLNEGNPNTQLPVQMTEDWLRYIAREKLSTLDGLQKQTSGAILDAPKGFIQKYVVAVDKTKGEINFLKLGKDF
ncbi:hypothetical protein EDL98_09345 [Ornithobacterium rhinotracheale]|uniref:hypothetical protein n=1 Tax=Ornithobacterium rhinotracheale TaxID=28251 RepID=UPI00129C6176|nr:hypothetical protein [Ornithobacterium rhinotracheale]MRJ11277.1 hypothetical protein [Ornithobacterium rhinotracheale]